VPDVDQLNTNKPNQTKPNKIKSSVGNKFDAVTVNELSSHKTEGPVACEMVCRSFMYNMPFSNHREKETYKRQVQGTKLARIQ
jgi:hypothetical protein